MRHFFILLLFSGYTLFAQKNLQIQVSYQMYLNGDWPIQFPAVLHVNDSITIYQGQLTQKRDWENGNANPMPYPGTHKPVDDYIKINHKSGEIYFFDELPNNSTELITDLYPEISWDITTEQKVITGYDCIKATAQYRGRRWTAWFAPSIAIPYGPWKLHGLPGLILEAYDDEKLLTIKFTKIERKGSVIFDKPFTSLRNCRNSKPTAYKEFLANRDEAMENMVLKMRAKNPNMQIALEKGPRAGLELKYEWEE